MANNYRIFVEKYPEFQVEAASLKAELNENLQLDLSHSGFSMSMICSVLPRNFSKRAVTASSARS